MGSFGADADFAGGGTAAQPNATISVAGVPDAAPAGVYTAERDGAFTAHRVCLAGSARL